MNKIIFLGGLFPNELKKDIELKSSGTIQYAADALQWSIVDGLDLHTSNLQIVTLPYIGSFPSRYKDLRIRSFSFAHRKDPTDLNIGFINLPLYKLYSRYRNSKSSLLHILENQNEVVIIYAIHTPFIKAAVEVKQKYPSTKICLIVPDLPQYMDDQESSLKQFLKNKEQGILNSLLAKVDFFVLLSDYMHQPLNIGERPWVRIEGIFNDKEKPTDVSKENFKTIFYSGTLAKRYGILNLLEAFSMIRDGDYRLWICGDGDAKKELEEAARSDNRIIDFGQIPREEVLILQKRATVLVNPRTTVGEFTKYSFPSKTMEYLASGTPCIMYKLPGVPLEYYDFFFAPEDETPFALYAKILEVCEMEKQSLQSYGDKAKDFILKNKTPKIQCGKIYNMLKDNQ